MYHTFATKFATYSGMIRYVIPGHCRTALARMLSGDALEAISEKDWLILTLTVITKFQLVKRRHQFTS